LRAKVQLFYEIEEEKNEKVTKTINFRRVSMFYDYLTILSVTQITLYSSIIA
jgi:hypothetical protein